MIMQMRTNYMPPSGGRGPAGQDWSGEVTPEPRIPVNTAAADGSESWDSGGLITSRGTSSLPENWNREGEVSMRNGLPMDVINNPTTTQEAYQGSLRAMLSRYVGNFIVATFLVGTQNTVSWEGILYDVGNDYMTIYQAARERYIVTDIYSLKYIEFYDTRKREMCNTLMRERG